MDFFLLIDFDLFYVKKIYDEIHFSNYIIHDFSKKKMFNCNFNTIYLSYFILVL